MKKSEFIDLYQKILERNQAEFSKNIALIKRPTNQTEIGGFIGEVIAASNSMNEQILLDTIMNLGILEDDQQESC